MTDTPKRKTKTTPEGAPTPEPAPEEAEVLDGVFVVKRVDPASGDLLPPQVIKNGNLGLLEVESLLKLGLKEFQEKMGFS